MIRLMQETDIDKIVELEKAIFTLPWSCADFEYELNDNPFSKLYVLEHNGQIIGYAGLWITFEQAQITTIGIVDNQRKNGYGDFLLKYLESIAKDNNCEIISLEVRVSNQKAINLYKKNGFEIINIRKGYYSDNHEDAYLMMKGV